MKYQSLISEEKKNKKKKNISKCRLLKCFSQSVKEKQYTFYVKHPCLHYENMPIQIYWKFYHQKLKIFR